MVIGNRIDHDIESPKECESLGLSLGLAAFTAVVYPLAYVVSATLAATAARKSNILTMISPLPAVQYRVDSKSIILLFFLARPSNDFLRNFPHVTAY